MVFQFLIQTCIWYRDGLSKCTKSYSADVEVYLQVTGRTTVVEIVAARNLGENMKVYCAKKLNMLVRQLLLKHFDSSHESSSIPLCLCYDVCEQVSPVF